MSQTVKEKLEAVSMFDMPIDKHHFAPCMRDYDVIVDILSPSPHGIASYVAERCLFRFTHCALVEVKTPVELSWEDVFTDYEAWGKVGAPDGFVWGVGYQFAYLGLNYVEKSELAKESTERLRKTRHEVIIETNCQNIKLVFHDVIIKTIAVGDPHTNKLTPVQDI